MLIQPLAYRRNARAFEPNDARGITSLPDALLDRARLDDTAIDTLNAEIASDPNTSGDMIFRVNWGGFYGAWKQTLKDINDASILSASASHWADELSRYEESYRGWRARFAQRSGHDSSAPPLTTPKASSPLGEVASSFSTGAQAIAVVAVVGLAAYLLVFRK